MSITSRVSASCMDEDGDRGARTEAFGKSVPFSFDVHAMIFHDDASAWEPHMHFLTAPANLANPQ